MARGQIADVVIDRNGRPRPNVVVTVADHVSHNPVAIYADEHDVTPIDRLITDRYGVWSFWTEQGQTIDVQPHGAQSRTYEVVSGAATGVHPDAIAASNATYSTGTITFTGGPNVTVGTDVGQKVSFSAADQTTHSHSTAPAAISASDTLFTSGTVRFTGGPNITVGTDASGVSFSGANPGAGGGGISGLAASDTTYTSGTVQFTGSNNVTVATTTGQKVIISGPTVGGAQTGISGIAASDTTYTSGTVQFSGENNITVHSTTGQKVLLSGPNTSAQQTGISGVSASDTVFTSGTVRFTGGPNVTVGSDASGVSFSGANPGGAAGAISAWRRVDEWAAAQAQPLGTTHRQPIFFPLVRDMGPFPAPMTVSTMGLGMSWSTAATSVSQSLSSSLCLGLYTLNGASLSLISSGSVTFGNAAAATINGSNRWNGQRLLTFAPPAGLSTYSQTPYWMGLMFSSHITTIAGSILQAQSAVDLMSNFSGVQGNSATAVSNQPFGPFKGQYSATSAVLPASVSRGDITGYSVGAANQMLSPYLFFNNIFIP